ncbi:hypothetical protein J3R83DRAFT_1532 [Lanmaoa asiatica]|nr:hypothetical protein J3R83DRAFT_1532 [Lanmaoa asiatica]
MSTPMPASSALSTPEAATSPSETHSSPNAPSSASANNGGTSPYHISIDQYILAEHAACRRSRTCWCVPLQAKVPVVGTRPLGEYTERLDIVIRDYSENPDADLDSLTTLITCMPHLAIVSFAMVPNYFTGTDLPNNVLHALQYSAASLRVLDWSTTCPEQSASRFVDLLAKCTQLRVLNCPLLVWSRELQHGGVPLTVTTLRVRALIPVQIVTNYHHSDFDPDMRRHPGPSALQELVLDLNRDLYHWEDLLNVYSAQLVSVQLYVSGFCSSDVDAHLQLLARVCPDLRRLTIISWRFSPFIRPNFVFPSITCLRLRATRMQLPKPDFEMLFAFLEELKSSVPSLQVVQLVDEYNVQCLLKTHNKFAVRALQPFMEAAPFRIEDKGGVLLTGSQVSCWVIIWTDRFWS